ncbi:MAG: PilZ domain-containing protein [Candidatus Omnitrophica bacterium]|nr:PilZ domain-containing protein [Candidatus Omnitrophota bacterium]
MDSDVKKDGSERRRAKRVYASFVEYCRAEALSSQKYQAFAENISATGICIFVNELIEAGSLLLITIYLLDGSTPIETKGRVAWTRPSVFVTSKDKKHFDLGIEFVDISEEDRERLLHYTVRYAHEIPPSEKAV